MAALLVLSGVLAGCGGHPYVAPRPTAVASVDPGQATTTLESLQAVVRRGDAAAARRFGADGATADLLAAIARNVRAIGLGDVGFTYLTENGSGSLRGSWGATVQVSWKVDGFDHQPASTEVSFTFADGGKRISRVGGRQNAIPVWLSGPVTVRRTPQTLVISAAPPAVADRLATEARTALARDAQVLGRDHDKLVVEAPATVEALHRALDAQPPTYSGIAAVTAPVDGNRTPGTPVHVFVNPVVFRSMDRTAAQVVMTHESVHAVTDAPLRSAPLWLIEGFADYVALGEAHVPLAKEAAQVAQQVRRHGVPAHLPADSSFGTEERGLESTYEAAWRVNVTIAQHAGQPALVRFYRDMLRGGSLARVLPADTGLTVAGLTADWRGDLASLPHVAG
ncbi:MAG: hypothetical protein FWE71_14650 [Nocardioidaceae bacterium]|nr:hypothetical protein [Nocardioidaceae bacterium]MCL2615007.1 hypothetical protein [Nocardioidaceae bacterium]